ncbi:serine hydrolase domain-containing protein [Sinanaerobacter sp. ZZT-01]|uniref:serine hydrolase domain-containing protein n=1 Tax=Sinanaerobacter sp. ZZT-01 TaxID=3111540 RepID=UPI002D7A04D9|nr:serine hydrolase domain-containing protein [Sinanaerobacter sp. ZZT-01]WRR93635.1 serine hydrolase domain-containing protein [Sinanaerobacter sp. ZZT-01]
MEQLRDKLNHLAQASVEEYSLPGLVLGINIGKNSKIAPKGFHYKGAAGYRNVETKEAMYADHIFHMASVTKLFVGTAVMQLWEKGILSLEERLTDLFPLLKGVQPEFEEVTVRHLLTHTSGLSNVKDFGWDKPEIEEGALQSYVVSNEVKEIEFLSRPDDAIFHYSDVGYEILGAVIEKKTGTTFEEYIRKNIFELLGMKQSTLLTFERTYGLPEIKKLRNEGEAVCNKTEIVKQLLSLENLSRVGLAIPHKRDEKDKMVLEANYPYNRVHGPSSTLTSSISDMQRFAESHLNHITGRHETASLLEPETYEMIWKKCALVPNNREHIGLSWFIREQNGYFLYGHEGTDDGFRASFWICPQLDVSILVNSNITKAPVKRISKKAFELIVQSHI